MKIEKISHSFTVCKVEDYTKVRMDAEYCFIEKTDKENSLVCISEDVPENTVFQEAGWIALRIQGELDFSMVGIISTISGLLAQKANYIKINS